MADRIPAVLDHVAIAVPAWEPAEKRWAAQLGAGRLSAGDNGVFAARQLRFGNGGKLELLRPSDNDDSDGNFVRRFLQRFGAQVHHVTLKVPDLHAALDVVAGAGLEPVDVRDDRVEWQEAFLRPSQIGGLVVQIAASTLSEGEWAAMVGFTPEDPAPGAAALRGPLLRHPDLDAAAWLWTTLGADVTPEHDALRCTWPDSPLDVVVERGTPAGPAGLRMRGAGALDATAEVGPAVIDRD